MRIILKLIFSLSLVFVFFFAANTSYAFEAPPPGCEDPINVDVNYWMRHCMGSYDYLVNDPSSVASRLSQLLTAAACGNEGCTEYWYATPDGGGGFWVSCSNQGVRYHFFPNQQPTQPPPQPPACGQGCYNDSYCVLYDTSDGCTKCDIPNVPVPTPDSSGNCPEGYTKGGSNAALNTCTQIGPPGTCKRPITPTPTTPPQCGTPCTQSGDCAGAALNCTLCVANKCTAPSPTPTPTTPPQCGTPCTQSGDCAGAALNCSICVANKCTAPSPTPTLTPTPIPQCGTPCTQSGNCAGAALNCNLCVANKCTAPSPTPTLTPTPIPPTPTPTFNPAVCKCNGIEYTPLVSGQNVTITSNGKVEGADTSKAQISTQKFFLTQGADDISGQIIAQSGPLPASAVSGGIGLVNYQSKWSFIFPKLVSGNTYRIWSQITCIPKTTGYKPRAAVAGASTTAQSTSIFTSFMNFLQGLFGAKPQNNSTVAPTTQPVSVQSDAEITPAKESLQLQTISPVEVYQKTCSFIKLRYNF